VLLEQFLSECRQIKMKVTAVANQEGHRQLSKAFIRNLRQIMIWHSSQREAQESGESNSCSLLVLMVKKVVQVFLNHSESMIIHNQNKHR